MKESIHDIEITGLGAQGDGLARWEGTPVYIPRALTGEKVRARFIGRRGEGWEAEPLEVIQASPERAVPPCAHFVECGGCQLQHMQIDAQSRFKEEKLQRALSQAKVAWQQAEYIPLTRYEDGRRRVEFTLQSRKGRIRLAYQQEGAHRKIAIGQCLVLLPQLQRLVSALPEALSALPEARLLESLKLTAADEGIDAVLRVSESLPPALLEALATMAAQLGLARLSVQEKEGLSTPLAVLGPVQMILGGEAMALPPDAFLQASPQAQSRLQEEMVAALTGVGKVADLFCGLGTYTVPLAKTGHEVLAVEGDAAMTIALRQLAQRPSLQGRVQVMQRDLFALPLRVEEWKGIEGVAINPPRAGAKAQAEQLAKVPSLQVVAMVSCNPTSFARDAALLQAGGWKLTRLAPVDQFPHTTHLEVVGIFKR